MKRIYWKYIALFIMILIFFFSSQNGEDSSRTSGFFVKYFLHLFPFLPKNTVSYLIRKSAHFTIFGCLGFSIFKSLLKKNIYLPVILSFLYACSDEFHQFFSAARSCQLSDVFLDTCGAFLFVLIAYWIHKKKESCDSLGNS